MTDTNDKFSDLMNITNNLKDTSLSIDIMYKPNTDTIKLVISTESGACVEYTVTNIDEVGTKLSQYLNDYYNEDPLERIVRYNGFHIEGHNEYGNYTLQQYTEAGEDWNITVDKLENFHEVYDNFNPEDEFNVLWDAKQNGFAGVPGPDVLWKDQLWKQQKLLETTQAIEKFLKNR